MQAQNIITQFEPFHHILINKLPLYCVVDCLIIDSQACSFEGDDYVLWLVDPFLSVGYLDFVPVPISPTLRNYMQRTTYQAKPFKYLARYIGKGAIRGSASSLVLVGNINITFGLWTT